MRESIKTLLKAIQSAPSAANFLTSISIAFLLIKVFILNRYSLNIFGLYELGLIVEGTLISVIASYIFFIYVVQFKELKDKEITAPYIVKHCNRIISTRDSILRDISKQTKLQITADNLDKEVLTSALIAINAKDDAPMVSAQDYTKHVNWIIYMYNQATHTKRSIAKLLEKVHWLSPEILYTLTEIEEDSFIGLLDTIKGVNVNYTDLKFLADGIEKHNDSCNSLRKLINQNLNY